MAGATRSLRSARRSRRRRGSRTRTAPRPLRCPRARSSAPAIPRTSAAAMPLPTVKIGRYTDPVPGTEVVKGTGIAVPQFTISTSPAPHTPHKVPKGHLPPPPPAVAAPRREPDRFHRHIAPAGPATVDPGGAGGGINGTRSGADVGTAGASAAGVGGVDGDSGVRAGSGGGGGAGTAPPRGCAARSRRWARRCASRSSPTLSSRPTSTSQRSRSRTPTTRTSSLTTARSRSTRSSASSHARACARCCRSRSSKRSSATSTAPQCRSRRASASDRRAAAGGGRRWRGGRTPRGGGRLRPRARSLGRRAADARVEPLVRRERRRGAAAAGARARVLVGVGDLRGRRGAPPPAQDAAAGARARRDEFLEIGELGAQQRMDFVGGLRASRGPINDYRLS